MQNASRYEAPAQTRNDLPSLYSGFLSKPKRAGDRRARSPSATGHLHRERPPTPDHSCVFSKPDRSGIIGLFPSEVDGSTSDDSPNLSQDSVSQFTSDPCRMHLAMWHLLKLATISLRCIPAFFRSRSKQAIVELALRQQLATFAEKGRRPRIAPADRGFWVLLSRVWSGWKGILVIVQPETVVRWHRKGFRLYWRSISKRGPGRPPIPVEIQTLIRRFANENGWRARKVRAELAKLGISVGLSTVSRYLPKRDPDHDQRQRWRTFLRNHKNGIAAMDFLVVPTARFRL